MQPFDDLRYWQQTQIRGRQIFNKYNSYRLILGILAFNPYPANVENMVSF